VNLGVRAKFFLVTVLLVVTVDLAAGTYLQWKLRADHEARIEAELSRHTVASQAFLELNPPPWTPHAIDPIADRLGAAMQARVTIIDARGAMLGDSDLDLADVLAVENHGDRPEFELAASRQQCGPTRRHSETLDTDMLYCAAEFVAGQRIGYVRLSMPLETIDAAIARLRLILVFAALLSTLLATGVGWLVSRRFSRKVRMLMEAARAMAEGDPDRRMPAVGTDELGGLAGSFNRVAEELERTVKAMAAERDLFEAVLQSMDESVIAVDHERCIIAVNRAAIELLGISAAVRGHSLLDAVQIPELSEALDAAIRGESCSVDVKLDRAGSVRHLLVRATPQGESGGAVVVIHDVTEVRRLETVRRDFVANVSHELRTPVSIIQANTETLLAGALDEPAQARRFLDAVRRNAERLGQLIGDLLDISRIEAGKYKIDKRAVALAAVVRAVSKAVSEACRRRGVMLEIDIDQAVLVWADPGALEQVLINLVENAVKYGPEGGTVEIAAVEQGSMLRIEVRDEGPGIAPSHRRRVFERFYRVDPGRSRGMGGTGLGLAIVKNLTEAMGGDVGVDPREPTGSIFWLRLGRAPNEEAVLPLGLRSRDTQESIDAIG
jgi:two-component system phosphate regulon sensor histidine kinase PhoR